MSDPMERAVASASGPSVSLVIVLKPNGKMDISGPIENKALCYDLLIRAAVAIAQHQPAEIVVPKIIPPGNIRPA